ncbi:Solute carrier family 2, facilitated glucose transporter member 2 [Larimichthys crocea]|uniref:Solute carrier family 2, facilitated glucose transporter member 2 n=1 Tax=Larimichthys crocea TaxID=215358 RepID=A0A6G0IF38_LARCR|nr:Solute carrier family 2, facilitated glucose transporter member 2 [Larimichthys crocea]
MTPGKLTGTLALAVFTAVLGSLQYGYSLGVINAPQAVIEKHYGRSLGCGQTRTVLSENSTVSHVGQHPAVTMYWSLSVQSSPLAACYPPSWVKGMLMVNVLAIAAGLLMGLCRMWKPHIMVISGRAVMGFYCGLLRLKGEYDPTPDLEEMRKEKEAADKEPRVSILSLIRSSVYRQQLVVALMMHLSQQFSGINAVALVDRAGRRTLTLVGLGGMCCCAVVMTVGLKFQSEFTWMSYVSMSAIFLFVSFFEVGPGPIPWFIVAELFSQGPRPAAIALAGCCNWTSNFIIGMTFPYREILGCYVFILFAVLLLAFTVFTYLRVPETKGKTFEEIAAVFLKRRKSQRHQPQRRYRNFSS